MNISRTLLTCLAGFYLLIVSQGVAMCYPASAFEPHRLLKNSSVVAKIQVLSTKTNGTCIDHRFNMTVSCTTAHVKLLSTIKGSPIGEFDIAYPNPKDVGWARYPSLGKDEITLVFLSGNASPYHFTDINNDQMKVSAALIPFQPQQTPEQRLQAEIDTAANDLRGLDQLLAIERMGQMGGTDAILLLRKFSESPDMVVAAQALIARIRANDPPDAGVLLAFLKRNPADFNTGAAMKKYHATRYNISDLQGEIIWAVSNSIREDDRHPQHVVRMPGFPYLDFFRQALQADMIKKNDNSLGIAIGSGLRKLADKASIPLLINLLGHSDANLRYFAVTTLARINGRDDLFISTGRFHANEQKYLSYWREWWKQHKDEYK